MPCWVPEDLQPRRSNNLQHAASCGQWKRGKISAAPAAVKGKRRGALRDAEGAVGWCSKGGRGWGTAPSAPRLPSQPLAGLPTRTSLSPASQPSHYFSCNRSFPDRGAGKSSLDLYRTPQTRRSRRNAGLGSDPRTSFSTPQLLPRHRGHVIFLSLKQTWFVIPDSHGAWDSKALPQHRR